MAHVAALAELHEQVHALQQQHIADAAAHAIELQQLGEAFAAQQAQIAAAAVAAAAPGAGAHGAGVRQMRATPPDSYDGSSRISIDRWVQGMEQSFTYMHLFTDVLQVELAAVSVKGPALEWYNSTRKMGAPPTTWATFEAGLRARFQPVTTADIARGRMDALRQGKRPVVEYVDAFRRLVGALPLVDVGSLLYNFQRGLAPELRLINLQHHPATLEEAISLAVRTGSVHWGAAANGTATPMELNALAEDAYAEGAPSTTPSAVHRSSEELSEWLAAMFRGDRDRVRPSGTNSLGPRPPPRITGLTAEQVKEYMDAGLCFGCRSTEHMSRQCPRRKVGADGRVSWSPKSKSKN